MERIKVLILKHLRGEITLEEQQELEAWLALSEASRELFAEINDPDRVAVSLEKMDRLKEERVWERLQRQGGKKGGGVYFLRRGWWAVASVLFLGLGAYLLFRNKPMEQKTVTQAQRFRNDVAPGKNAAVLTLSGGQKIVLDSSSSGAVSKQGNTTIINANGQLVYNALHEKPTEMVFNTLSTGKGNQYRLVLPDGSGVWLNASSSITYPTAFVSGERKVAITGEAYFEIAKDESRPFIVEEGDVRVQVLGTHFNVNTYDDEASLRTTLLEGSVKIVSRAGSSILKPGQQAILNRSDGQIKVVDDANPEEVMAWKNGFFKFNDATIESIMRQAARWYDVEVEYDTRVSKHFVADIPRDVPLSDLLKMLELTDQVHFKIEGRKITVIR